MSSAGAGAGAGAEPSRSSIVANKTSGHHYLTIHGYSYTKGIISTGECVRSLPFTVGGHRWRIHYYPNGACYEFADCVCVALILDEVVAVAVKAKWDICLAGEEEREAKQVASLSSRPLDDFASRKGWWYRSFVKREELESSRYLRDDDSFTVRCDIVVVQGCLAVEEPAVAFVSVPRCDLRRHLGELLESGKGADVVFEVGGETIAAHRCVLAARSSVFSAELFGPMMEGDATGVVRIEDMDAEVFKALLHFAYTGSLPELTKEDENVTSQHLLVAADRYGMERLKLICEEKLCGNIDVGSAATICALAEQHHCEGLKKACFDFLGSPANMKAVIATDGFQHLSRSCPSLMVEIVAIALGTLAAT